MGYRTSAPSASGRACPASDRLRGLLRAALTIHPAKADVLDLDVLVDPVLRAFPAEPRLLDPAERRDLGRDQAGVDPDHAVLERLGHPPDAPDIARVEVRREPEFGAVRELDHFGIGLEADQRHD